MEYTLEDAFETLKDTRVEREREIEELKTLILNNEPIALNKAIYPEEVRKKQYKLGKSLLNQVLKEEPKDYPLPNTLDLHVEVLAELEEEVQNAKELLDKMKAQLSDINDDISYLENKKMGLENMKEAYLNATKIQASETYSKEYAVTKHMFQIVKKDLHLVVETLFPENQDFKDFLAELTVSYTKGGNDTYVDVTPNVLEFVHFLIEADIITYHRNDKTKVRLMDML